jgi:hypothetical protein
MISVILYGRNDAHGYNLHRRAALSLNCLAEVLTDPDDELIFVDYNTPDELPTFIEAISDTLTERCLGLLRVLRVPSAVHEQRFAPRTHLPALEPIARNVAARRANPANRWLLSTNTDMIFLPLDERSMSDICRDLPDGFYGLPRFELPEWLWERLPRSDPRRALAEVERLGPGLRLDEPTTSHEWIRFDAPGDCQLILREDLVAIDGFHEDMLLGYHVDSNLSRRMLIHRGSIDSLEEHLAGYHCNHNRTPTVYHGRRIENDLHRFFYAVDQSTVPEQRERWGLVDVSLSEVRLRDSIDASGAGPLIDVMPARPRSRWDAMETPFILTYDSGHVLPFIADTLFVSSRDSLVGYVGANLVLRRMLTDTVAALGFEQPLAAAPFTDMHAIERIADSADILIIDLGADVSESDEFLLDFDARDLGEIPPGLVDALTALYHLFGLERARFERVKHPRPVVLVNSSAVFWEASILTQFDCSYATVHSRVRRATVKPVPDEDPAEIERQHQRALQLMRWSARPRNGNPYMPLRRGERVVPYNLETYAGFGTGWSPPEAGGIWTLGPRAELRIGVTDLGEGDHALSLLIGMVCVDSADPLDVALLANGERVASRRFADSAVGGLWRVALPSHLLGDGTVELTFLVDEPRSPLALGWSTDDRALGVHLLTLSMVELDRSIHVGETLVISESLESECLLGDGWAAPEATGAWTVEERARIALRVVGPKPVDVDVVLNLVPFVTNRNPRLSVEVWVREQRVATQVFRDGEPADPLCAHLLAGMMDEAGRATLELRLSEPSRPRDVGYSEDPRRLGVYLQSLAVTEPGARLTAKSGVTPLRKLRRQLRRSQRMLTSRRSRSRATGR